MRGDYRAASAASVAGREQFEAIGQAQPAALLAEYGTLANRGLHAEGQLAEAGHQLRSLQIREAHTLLTAAYTTFSELGDEARAAQARSTLTLIARGEQVLGGVCLAASALLITVSARRRHRERGLVLPFS